jgi:hypothetical protein
MTVLISKLPLSARRLEGPKRVERRHSRPAGIGPVLQNRFKRPLTRGEPPFGAHTKDALNNVLRIHGFRANQCDDRVAGSGRC